MAQFCVGITIGRVWNGLEWIGDDSEWKNLEIGVSARERSNVPANIRTLGLASEWLGLNVRTLKPAGVLAWKDAEFECST